MRLTAGTEIGRYKLIDVRGRGGVGVVHRAVDLDLDRVVALKLIDPRFGTDPDVLGRFALEAELSRVLEHPNVMPIYEAGEHEGLLYIAMPLIEGPSLKELVMTEGFLLPRRAWPIVAQIADALDAAHEVGVVHRDVKPQNILIAKHERRDHALLTDFGLVKQMTLDSELTNTGQLMGSLHYLAPEQIEGRPTDARADVYSLGCVLFECLTGRVPFTGETGYALLWSHVNTVPPRASELRPDLGVGIDLVIGKALAKQPADRHLTAGDLAEDARRALRLPRRKPSPTARAFEENTLVGPRDVWAKPPGKAPVLVASVPPEPPAKRWSFTPIAIAIAILVAGIPILRTERPIDRPTGSPVAGVDVAGVVEGTESLAIAPAEQEQARYAGARRPISTVASSNGGEPAPKLLAPDPADIDPDLVATELHTSPVRGVNGKIAFEEGGDIFTMFPDGSQLRNLTAQQPGFAYWPRWSPDGFRIAYQTDPGDVWVMDANGSNARRLVTGFRPSWSPDGSRIAYMANGTQGSFDILVTDAAGGGVSERLAFSSLDEWSPAWSPDGAHIAFTRGVWNARDHGDIWIMGADGSNARALVERPLADTDPAWAPDGKTLVFNGIDDEYSWDVFTTDLDGRNLKQLTNGWPVAGHPTYSPDGRKIVFIAGNADAWRVHKMNPDGTDPRVILPGSGIQQVPSWQSRCTVMGSAGSDRLIGTVGADLICGRGGDDILVSLGGSDRIFGGPGDDRIVGGLGQDLLVGELGADVLLGGADIDRLSGGLGRDTFKGGHGGDFCYEPDEPDGTRCA